MSAITQCTLASGSPDAEDPFREVLTGPPYSELTNKALFGSPETQSEASQRPPPHPLHKSNSLGVGSERVFVCQLFTEAVALYSLNLKTLMEGVLQTEPERLPKLSGRLVLCRRVDGGIFRLLITPETFPPISRQGKPS